MSFTTEHVPKPVRQADRLEIGSARAVELSLSLIHVTHTEHSALPCYAGQMRFT